MSSIISDFKQAKKVKVNTSQVKMISALKQQGLLRKPENKLVCGPDFQDIEKPKIATNCHLFI